MNIGMVDAYIPGTAMRRETMGEVTGRDFLDKVFFITDGIMLSQIREITGLDSSTLQNWVKRGWVGNAVQKKYSKNQLARILIINMIRESMQLERIDFLLKYINGHINCEEDDIIPEARLYDMICRITDRITTDEAQSDRDLNRLIEEETADYEEKVSGARRRLCKALEIIVCAYYATLLRSHANKLYDRIRKV